MKMFKLFSVMVVLALMLSAFAPTRVSAAASGDIVQVLSGDQRFNTLVAAVGAAGLVETLQGPGPFTVFAPTDSAFNKLGKKTIDALLADPATLSSILLYHNAAGKQMAADVVSQTSIATVNGAPVVVRLQGGKVYINNARVIQTDIEASNGVIHVLDTVLLPPTQDIVGVLDSRPQFSTLVAAVGAAGLVETLQGAGPFTVLAPTNEAFNRLGKKTIDALLADPARLTSILTYHVVPGAAYSGDVKQLTHVATVNGAEISIQRRGEQLFVNNVRITRTDILATNGVIHVLNAVILPPSQDIVDTLANDSRFDTLSAAIDVAGLSATLKSAGPFTVFAPTDSAFNKLGKKTIDALLADPATLANILTYHALSGAVYSGDARQASFAKTVNGADVAIKVKGGQLFINNARVVVNDILTTNGVIHAIDTVLLPPAKDIVDTLAADRNFDTLSAAIQAAGLTTTLKSAGPFTLFAPTDAAFNKLGKKTIDALLADPTALANILTYHAVSGAVYAGDVVKQTTLTTVQGQDVTITVKRGQVFINNARVVMTDILTTNGVIHVINAVLIPPAP